MAGKGVGKMVIMRDPKSSPLLRGILGRAVSAAVCAKDFSPGTEACREALHWLNFGLDVQAAGCGVQPFRGIFPSRSLTEALGERASSCVLCLFGNACEHAAYAEELQALKDPPLLIWAEHPEILENIPFKRDAPFLSGARPSQWHAAFFDGSSPLFSCKMCGICCEGRGGIVVSPRDLPRLCAFFGLAPADVLERYTELMRGQPVIRCGEDGYCMFYRKGAGCSIHPARPAVCRAWPFFRGNLVDEVSFGMARQDCPGICRQCSHEEFAWEGWRYLTEYRLLADDPRTEGRMLIVKKEDLPPGRQEP